ncbi:HAD family hydrolase [Sphingopyxis macrogoltabida]|uniref:Haloacid dehalogenase n=1 Tax=Sphingopyxis macrogoltabida TaxID=33050 RepID=A0AAC8YY85_SPHMC|nr:HAD-IA family hydrolase [Sphingopyxis macrogoltabida]ALJ12107.1 haloacid dehalogenase [Sphingopyxis macrogoltabida]AMU88282.1 haloacid dehalogenase [Sphingopyxis macrogoltabida]
MKPAAPVEAVLFDLLTALLDSWSVWNHAAGSAADGLRWRRAYLRLTYGCGSYRPYEDLVREAAAEAGVAASAAEALTAGWDMLRPWPEVPRVLGDLAARGVRLGVVTNCSVTLGRQAAEQVGVPFSVVMTSEEAGCYKPHPQAYRAALDRLGADPERTLFVAGSPADIPGAAGVGMSVFWHNRAGLPFVADTARPLLIADTLDPLVTLA